MSESMVGKWPHHVGAAPAPYGPESPTYRMGAEWLKGCWMVEDRGCGLGWFSKVMAEVDPACQVIGLDGSKGPSERFTVDLARYASPAPVPGVFMRHVLEHNNDWRKVLDCACRSFTKRMCLVMFTPLCPECDQPHDLYLAKFGPNAEYVAWSLRESDIAKVLDAHNLAWTRESLLSMSVEFNVEHVFRIERKE